MLTFNATATGYRLVLHVPQATVFNLVDESLFKPV